MRTLSDDKLRHGTEAKCNSVEGSSLMRKVGMDTARYAREGITNRKRRANIQDGLWGPRASSRMRKQSASGVPARHLENRVGPGVDNERLR